MKRIKTMRDKDWWKDACEDFGMRSVFHALCEYEGHDVWADILEYVSERPWVADLKERFAAVSILDRTIAWEPGNDELLQTLYLLYASSRVRDVLLFARQPETIDPAMQHGLDDWLNRTEPTFEALPLDKFQAFFAAIGCQPVSATVFDPIWHEIVLCEAVEDPDAGITVVEELWPALVIGELVFSRAGVRVTAGEGHARPGIADRSQLYWEYWRRHRRTDDLSMGWGTNSQWGTRFRRDYVAHDGNVFNLDAGILDVVSRAGEETERLLSVTDLEGLVKNRCLLRIDPGEEHWPYDTIVDERRRR